MFVKKAVFFLISFAFIFLFGDFANALTISPVKNIITIGAKQEARVLVSVRNEETRVVSIVPFVQGVQQDKYGHTLMKINSDVAENWVEISKDIKKLQQGESASLEFVIKAPENVSPGTRYLGLGVKEINENNASVSEQVSSLLLLQVAGEARESLLVEDFYGKEDTLFKNEWPFFLQIKNNGNIELPLKGLFEIGNNKGAIVFSKDLQLGNKLLPQTERVVDNVLVFDKEKMFLPGKYFLKLNLEYGFSKQKITAVRSFWYFPKWSLLVSGAVLVFLFILLIFALVFRKKHYVSAKNV